MADTCNTRGGEYHRVWNNKTDSYDCKKRGTVTYQDAADALRRNATSGAHHYTGTPQIHNNMKKTSLDPIAPKNHPMLPVLKKDPVTGKDNNTYMYLGGAAVAILVIYYLV